MNPDKIYKVKTGVADLTKAKVEAGFPYLLDEYRQRPRLFETEAYWDKVTNKLITVVGCDIDETLEEGPLMKLQTVYRDYTI